MTFIGVDPGLEGSVAFLNGTSVHVEDTPVVRFERDGKVRRRYDVPGMAALLAPYMHQNVVVLLEQVNAHPENATRAAFLMGVGVGTWEGIIGALGLPLRYVSPVAWKRVHGLLRTDKQAARLRAQQLFPTADLRKKKDVGRADALLIAAYGRDHGR